MCDLISSTTFIWNISHFKKNSARYCHKCTYIFMWNTRYSCQILWNLNFLGRFSKGAQISNFYENPPSGSWIVQADRQTDMTKLIVAVRSFSSALRNVLEQLLGLTHEPVDVSCLKWKSFTRILASHTIHARPIVRADGGCNGKTGGGTWRRDGQSDSDWGTTCVFVVRTL
jgi:hypothetical protein